MMHMTKRSSASFRVGLGVFALIMAALAGFEVSAKQPQLGPGESFDGLREVKNTTADKVWMRADLDLTGYTKILPMNLGVEYSPVKGGSRYRASSFPVPANVREKFEALITEIVQEELAKSERYTITDQPGPDVLIVVGGLLDVVSKVPPEPTSGRSKIYLSQVAQATLVLELRDSETNTILMRVLDRRAAQRAGGATWSNTVTNTAEVRRLIRHWARLLRKRLDEAPSLTGADD